MIPTVYARVGEPVTFRGSAFDFGNAITEIQFSLDGGAHWTAYATAGAMDHLNVLWEFGYTPASPGHYILLVRSKNAEGKVSPEADFAEMVVGE